MKTLLRLWKEEDAATATEYAIIAAILGVSLVGIFIAFRQQIAGFFQNLGTQVQGNTNINP
jgi:Flp pilus assembly pilin Flp